MTWNVLQSASADSNSGASLSSLSAAYTSNLSSGSVLVCAVTCYNTTTSTVTDGSGNSFSKLASATIGGPSGEVSLWALATPAGDVGTKPTITATYADTIGQYTGMLVQEVSGIQAVLDGTAGTAGYVGTGPTGPPSYTSSVAGEYLVNVFGDDGYDVTAATTGSYALDANSIQGAADIIIAYKSSTGGTEAGQWSWGGAPDHNGIILVAFKLASGTSHTTYLTGSAIPAFISSVM